MNEMTIAERTAHLRTLRGLTQAELAARAHISRSSVASIETAHQGLSYSTIADLAAALGVTIAALIGETVIEDPPRIIVAATHHVRCDEHGLVITVESPGEADVWRQRHVDSHLRGSA
jgi:transcriptional regulator with XRE-family HTH domain